MEIPDCEKAIIWHGLATVFCAVMCLLLIAVWIYLAFSERIKRDRRLNTIKYYKSLRDEVDGLSESLTDHQKEEYKNLKYLYKQIEYLNNELVVKQKPGK